MNIKCIYNYQWWAGNLYFPIARSMNAITTIAVNIGLVTLANLNAKLSDNIITSLAFLSWMSPSVGSHME
jgi:hypothetical protein